MEHSELRDAMDACRAGSDDLRLPELALLADRLESDGGARRLFERIQRLDERIAEAAHDVPVPAGLAERVLARVERDLLTTGFVANESSPCEVAVKAVVPARRRSRRRTWSVIAIAVSLFLAVSLAALWPRHHPLTDELLRSDSGACTWFADLSDRAAWTPFGPHERGLAQYPFPNSVRATANGWSYATETVGRSAVAYRLATGRHSALFVIPSNDFDGPAAPLAKPQYSTGGWTIGWWQSEGMVYVLIV
ncbi:MAG TPA: hypothetical protein VG056_14375, partial [Pirellulales bacterium]|nr:hypothetical protein [Pirellulales bacterium]